MEAKLLEHQLKSAARKDSLAAQSNISDGRKSEAFTSSVLSTGPSLTEYYMFVV